ncbi:cysteine hydrolase family protein [Chloroflexota bacterium]
MAETKVNIMKTALLIIDMQNHFLDGKRDFFKGVYQQIIGNKVIENVLNVLNQARRTKLPVFHIITGHKADRSDVVPTITDMGTASKLPHLVENTPAAEIVDELKALSDETVVFKRRHGAFYQTDLELLIKTRGVDTLLFAGVLTDACVANTIAEARMRDYHIIVISDCCASSTNERHTYFIENVFPRNGRVRTSTEIIDALRG